MPTPPDALVFGETLAGIVRESGVMGVAELSTPAALGVFPESLLLDSLQVMRRIGIDPEEAACLCAIYMGIHQALVLADADPSVPPWPGDHGPLSSWPRPASPSNGWDRSSFCSRRVWVSRWDDVGKQ
uniref:Uncharacterized protein n=1 Tax=Phenylobacterium glaciei TaxID=2803784 RepID=A0A974P1P9_9CAUL|nr:hypothetical protein JKL49_15380 [Phenylobacterium glaciei]